MEDKPQDPAATPTPSPSGGVMDVQPPQSAAPAPMPTPVPPAPMPPEPAGPPVGAVPPTPTPVSPESQPQSSGLSPDLLAQAQQEVAPPTSTPNASHIPAPSAKNSGKKGHKGVILVAVAIALILSGVAVFAYMASQKKDTDHHHMTDAQHTQTEHHQQAQPATATDVENMAKDLDSTASSKDEAEDLPDEGLGNQATGL